MASENGRQLKNWINSKGLKVCYFAKQIGVNHCTLSRIMRTGKCSTQTAMLIKIHTSGEVDFINRG